MKRILWLLAFAAILSTGAVLAVEPTAPTPDLSAAPTVTAGPAETPVWLIGGCPRQGSCPDVYSPVICDGGAIYGNACYAFLACATNCTPYGGDEI